MLEKMHKKEMGNVSSSVLKLRTVSCGHSAVRINRFCSKFHFGFSPEALVCTPRLPIEEQTSTSVFSPSASLSTALTEQAVRVKDTKEAKRVFR